MILGYSTPVTDTATGITWSGTVDTSLGYLKDGRPGGLCQLTTSGTSTLTISFAHAPTTVHCAALINVSLDVGTTITATLKQVLTGYTVGATTADVVETFSGDRCVFFTWDGIEDVDGIQFSIPDEGQFTVGEAWVSPGLAKCIRSNWSSGVADINRDVSISGSVYVSPSVPRRTLVAEFAPNPYDTLYDEFKTAQVAISDDPRVLIIPDSANQTGIERTGMYARMTSIGDLSMDARGRFFTFAVSAEEMPGREP